MTRPTTSNYVDVTIRLPVGAAQWIDRLVQQGFWGHSRTHVVRALLITKLAEITNNGQMAETVEHVVRMETKT